MALLGLCVACAFAWLIPRLGESPTTFDVALRMLREGKPREASLLFESAAWRGLAEYRLARYGRAAEQFEKVDGVLGRYNLATSLVRLGDLDRAAALYERVLSVDPGHDDARHNLDLIRRMQALQQTSAPAQVGDAPGAAERSEFQSGRTSNEVADRSVPAAEREDAPAKSGGSEQNELGQGANDETKGVTTVSVRNDDDEQANRMSGSPAAIRERENRLEARILLQRIEDDPAAVLEARFFARHRDRPGGGR